MTRRSKTRAAAEAKPAPKSAKSPRTTPRRGASAKAAAAKSESGSTETVAASPRTKAGKAASAKTPKIAKIPKIAKPAKKPVATKAGAKAGAKKVDTASRRAKTAVPAESSTRKAEPRKANGAATKGARTGAKAASKAGAANAVAAPTAAKPKSGKAAVAKPARRPAKATRPPTRRKAPKEPAYLAAELGQPVDREGEPIGAGSAILNSDEALQEYALRLWRQMQSGGVVNRYMRAIERAGLTVDEVWTAGVIETRSTSSTADEMRRYKQKLLFRANLLEAILTETVADLHRLDGIVPSDAPSEPSPPQAASGSA